jgi:hypothetical protein
MPRSEAQLVSFRNGFVAPLDVVLWLLDLERRGAEFILQATGRFKVEPPDLLTAADREFIRLHRDEARRVLAYQADDSHLFTDTTLAQSRHLPPRQEHIA